jgi:hypothetical protein
MRGTSALYVTCSVAEFVLLNVGSFPQFLQILKLPSSGNISGPVIEVTSFEGTQQSRFLPLHVKTEADPVSETLCFVVFRIPDDGQIQKTQ